MVNTSITNTFLNYRLYWIDNTDLKAYNWDGTGVQEIAQDAKFLKFPNLLLVYKVNFQYITSDS